MAEKIPGGKRGDVFRLPDPHRVTIIGIDTNDGPEHPYYQTRIDMPIPESRVLNVAHYGNFEAVQVVKDGKHTDGPYVGQDRLVVVAGRQRVRWLREAVKRAQARGEEAPLLKVEILRKASEEILTGIMISENAHRSNDGVLSRALEAARLVSMGHSESRLALNYGVDTNTIRTWLKVAGLMPKVHKAIRCGDITATAAAKLSDMSRDEQNAAVAKLIEEARASGKKRPTVDDVAKGAPTPKPRALLPKATVRRLVADETFNSGLSADARAILRVLAGETAAIDEIPGLRAWLEAPTP